MRVQNQYKYLIEKILIKIYGLIKAQIFLKLKISVNMRMCITNEQAIYQSTVTLKCFAGFRLLAKRAHL